MVGIQTYNDDEAASVAAVCLFNVFKANMLREVMCCAALECTLILLLAKLFIIITTKTKAVIIDIKIDFCGQLMIGFDLKWTYFLMKQGTSDPSGTRSNQEEHTP